MNISLHLFKIFQCVAEPNGLEGLVLGPGLGIECQDLGPGIGLEGLVLVPGLGIECQILAPDIGFEACILVNVTARQ